MPTQQIEALRLQQDNLWDNFKNLEKKYNDLEKERVDLKLLEKQGIDVAIDDIKTRQSRIITQQKNIREQLTITQKIRHISNDLDDIVFSRLGDFLTN